MAEIEHFVQPTDKSHPKFRRVAAKVLWRCKSSPVRIDAPLMYLHIHFFLNTSRTKNDDFRLSQELVLFPSDAQLGSGRTISISIGDAVAQGVLVS